MWIPVKSQTVGGFRRSEMVLVLVLQQLLVVLLVSQHALGLQVEVFEGEESVLLPCEVKPSVSSGSTTVWDRDDFRIPTVHVREPAGDYLKDQNQRYEGRTSMMEDALQTGDLSLTLRKPTFTDSGTFTCTVRRMGEDLHQGTVELQVKEAPPPVWPWVLLGVLITVVLLVGPTAVWYYRWKKKHTAELRSETVNTREGEKSVLLPLKANRTFPQDVRVEWTRSGRRNIRIHVFENNQTQPEEQENIYEGRTKMRAEPLTTGDLSLTLKRPQLEDDGDYECVVYRGGAVVLRKTVTLKVKESLMEEVEVTVSEDVVRLPFKTLADLPHDAKVVWNHTDKPNTVHEYQECQNQLERQNHDYHERTDMRPDAVKTKDLTLTLKNPKLEDSGVYISTIYKKNGKILARKTVMLTVRVYKVEKVSVDDGKRSVVLPFHATRRLLSKAITVEWRLSDNKDKSLYKYETGQHMPAEDQDYGGRTEMNEDPFKTGDLSLTIRDLRLTDSVYTCTIYDENREMIQQKVVVLIVRGINSTETDSLKQRRNQKFPSPERIPLCSIQG